MPSPRRNPSTFADEGAESMAPEGAQSGMTHAACSHCGFAMSLHSPMDDSSAYDSVRRQAQEHVRAHGHSVEVHRPAYGMKEVHSKGEYGGVNVDQSDSAGTKLTEPSKESATPSTYKGKDAGHGTLKGGSPQSKESGTAGVSTGDDKKKTPKRPPSDGSRAY